MDFSKVRIGMNRREIKESLGEPDDISVEKPRKQPRIYKYGEIELHFEDGWDGKL